MSEFSNYENEEELVRFANKKRKALPLSPAQSNFKVYCILVVQLEDETILIHGTNGEQGYIGGAICAERAALLQLAHHKNPIIKKVIITTDSETPIAPGVLCREYLLSHATPDTTVVLANGESTQMCRTSLDELYPCKYVYRYQRRKDLLCFAEDFATNTAPVTDALYPGAAELYRRAQEVVIYDAAVALHPLQLAGGVLYSNGDIEVAWMLKALEYGSTLDPISQLVAGMERRRVQQLRNVASVSENGSTNIDDDSNSNPVTVIPKLLLMLDQFGVCHAPHAQARSLLTEHNYGDVLCIVHDTFGQTGTHAASSLVPAPGGHFPLTHDDFLKIQED